MFDWLPANPVGIAIYLAILPFVLFAVLVSLALIVQVIVWLVLLALAAASPVLLALHALYRRIRPAQ